MCTGAAWVISNISCVASSTHRDAHSGCNRLRADRGGDTAVHSGCVQRAADPWSRARYSKDAHTAHHTATKLNSCTGGARGSPNTTQQQSSPTGGERESPNTRTIHIPQHSGRAQRPNACSTQRYATQQHSSPTGPALVARFTVFFDRCSRPANAPLSSSSRYLMASCNQHDRQQGIWRFS
jgi:hypothetical protein